MNVNSNPTVSQQYTKKRTVSKFFSFIVCVVDTGVINFYFWILYIHQFLDKFEVIPVRNSDTWEEKNQKLTIAFQTSFKNSTL